MISLPNSKDVTIVQQPKLDTKGANPYPHVTLWCQDDTGADALKINRPDMDAIRKAAVRSENPDYTPEAPLLGYAEMITASDDFHWAEFRMVEVNMFDKDGNPMSEQWDMIDCILLDEDLTSTDPLRPSRLAGPWIRHRFYTSTVPDGSNRLWVGTNRDGWMFQSRPHIGASGMLWRSAGLKSQRPVKKRTRRESF